MTSFLSQAASLFPLTSRQKMADIDVEDVLSKLDVEEKISLLAGKSA